MFTGGEPALLFNMEHWMDRQGKEQSLAQEITNGIIHLINELGSIHQNRTVLYIMKWKVKTLPFLLVIFFPTVYQVMQYIYRLLPKCFKHLNFAFPCIKKITY